MGLLETLLNASGGGTQSAIAQKFGLSNEQVEAALKQLVPALSAGVKKNTGQGAGLESLMGALSRGNHGQYLDQPARLTDPAAAQEGNAILGHLLGSKETSRQVAANASAKTGIDQGILKQILPLAATMVMGSLSKNQGTFASGGQAKPDMLTSLLDADGDGSAIDDAMGMLKKFF